MRASIGAGPSSSPSHQGPVEPRGKSRNGKQVFARRFENGEKHNAPVKEGHVEKWPRRSRRQSQKPRSGGRDRAFGSAQERQEGPADTKEDELIETGGQIGDIFSAIARWGRSISHSRPASSHRQFTAPPRPRIIRSTTTVP